jgi:glycosyltransferase involved in cell wall biosynthesis
MAMKRLKILVSAFACHPPLEAGAPEEEKLLASGESILGWNIVNQIARFSDVWVLTQTRNRPGIERARARGEAAGIHFHYLDFRLWWKPLWHKSFTLHLYYYFWQWLALDAARRLRQEVDFDLAQHATFANDWMPSYIGARLGLPFVWGPIGGGQRNPKGFESHYGFSARLAELGRLTAQEFGRRMVRGRRQCLARARAILACNEETRLKIPERHRGKVRFFPVTGINRGDLHDPRPRTEDEATYRLLTTGRLVRYKRFDFALRAVEAFSRRNPGARVLLEIVGDGPEGPSLKSLADSLKLGDRVRFIPWMPRQELIARMTACDAFLFPSLREGGGIVVIEAMACGKPVVALNAAGPGFHVQPEWGIKIEPQNPIQVVDDLALALARLWADPDLRLRLGLAARRRAEDFYLWDRLGERLRDIQSEALTRPTAGERP